MCDLFLDVVVRQSLVILIDDFFVDLRLRELAPPPWKCISVCQHLFPESTFVLRLVFVVWSVVVSWSLSGHPRLSLCGHQCTVGVLAGTHPCATVSRVSLWQKANPCCVFVGVVGVSTSCVPCAHVRVRTSHSCAIENNCVPARLEALSKLSVVAILSASYHFHQIFCGLWVLSPTRHLVRDLIGILLLAVCSVAIHLVHANANLFLSRFTDQCRMLSRLSLDISAIFAAA